MALGVRDPGALPNVFARVQQARQLRQHEGLDRALATVIQALSDFALTQSELNKRLWESNRGLPAPHAESHIYGDDAIGGNLGGDTLTGIGYKDVSADYTFEKHVWLVRADASGGNVTVTLPPASYRPGRIAAVAKVDDTVNLVTIDGNVAEEIAGEASFDLLLGGETLSLISNGTTWSPV